MGCTCRCKTLVDGTPQLAISQGVQVSLYQQQEDGSFALLESASANNFFNGSTVGGRVQWRTDDQAIVYQSPVKPTSPLAGDFTLLQRDPLREHYFQGVQLADSGGNGGRFTGAGGYLIANGAIGGIDDDRPGPAKPQTVNSPSGWANTATLTGAAGSLTTVSGTTPDPLIATNFGGWGTPGLPPGATFAGVSLTVIVGVSPASFRDVVDDGIYLTLDGMNPVGTDQSKAYSLISGIGTWCPDGTATQETRTYGGWGYLPTIAEANASTFGVIFNAKSLSGAGEGIVESFTLTAEWSFTAAGIVYVLEKSQTFALGPCNKTAITSNIGPSGLQDISRLRPGATIQVMNAVNRTCRDNFYSTWSGTGLSVPPTHPRATTKTSPGVLCEWTDPTFTAYLDDSTGKFVGQWSGDDFCIAPPANFGVSVTTYSGPFCYTFDGTTFTPGTVDTITLPFSNPSGWSITQAVFAADGIHCAFVLGTNLYLAQRSGSNLASPTAFSFTGVDIGDINHTIATAEASVFDISADGGLLAFRATNGGSLPERVHIYSGGSVLAVLVPASIATAERIKQIKFSDDPVGVSGSIALAVCTDSGSGTGRTSVFTSTDGGSTWTETWQHPFVGQGVAFSHSYRVPT